MFWYWTSAIQLLFEFFLLYGYSMVIRSVLVQFGDLWNHLSCWVVRTSTLSEGPSRGMQVCQWTCSKVNLRWSSVTIWPMDTPSTIYLVVCHVCSITLDLCTTYGWSAIKVPFGCMLSDLRRVIRSYCIVMDSYDVYPSFWCYFWSLELFLTKVGKIFMCFDDILEIYHKCVLDSILMHILRLLTCTIQNLCQTC